MSAGLLLPLVSYAAMALPHCSAQEVSGCRSRRIPSGPATQAGNSKDGREQDHSGHLSQAHLGTGGAAQDQHLLGKECSHCCLSHCEHNAATDTHIHDHHLLVPLIQMLGDARFESMLSRIREVIHDDTHYQKGTLNMRAQKCFAVKVDRKKVLHARVFGA